MADPAWIQARADRLEAIFITHGHEDHVGALGLLWHRLQVPVYARRFTAALAKSKMERAGQPTDAVRQVAPWPHTVQAGPFTVGFLPDRALDPGELGPRHRHARGAHPAHRRLQDRPDAAGRRAVRRRGAARARRRRRQASWPATRPTSSAASGPLRGDAGRPDRAADARGRGPRRRHHLRLERRAAEDARRGRPRRRAALVVLGRAMNTMLKTARAAEVLDELPADPRLDRHRHRAAPPRCWCSPPAARASAAPRRAQLAQGRYMGLELRAGDTFLFSSKTIPGNEVSVAPHPEPAERARRRPSSTRATAATTSPATPTAPTS